MFDNQVAPNIRRDSSRRAFRVSVAAFLLAIPIGIVGLISLYRGPGVGIADRIRNARSSVVVEVVFQEPNLFWGDPGEILIDLRHDTTQAQLNAFWCDVVVPAGGWELPEQSLRIRQRTQEPGRSRPVTPDKGCVD
jgi:hypothetical protein